MSDDSEVMTAADLRDAFERWAEETDYYVNSDNPAAARWEVEIDGRWQTLSEVDTVRSPGAPISLFLWTQERDRTVVVPRDTHIRTRRLDAPGA